MPVREHKRDAPVVLKAKLKSKTKSKEADPESAVTSVLGQSR